MMVALQEAKSWVLDAPTQLYHYYQEEAGQEVLDPLCNGPVLMKRAFRLRVATLPTGLTPRYKSDPRKYVGVCASCWHRYHTLNLDKTCQNH